MITIDGFVIDASLRETHTHESEVTKYPIESGGKNADHIQPEPVGVEIEAVVSDTPLPGPVADARGPVDANGNFRHRPSDDALAKLEAIDNAREPITITTALKTYENMALTSLEIPRDAETGFALGFTARFEQIKYATNQRAIIKVAPPQQTTLGPKKDLGNKTTFDLKKGAQLWHHSEPAPAWSFVEVLGYNADDARTKGTTGLYHINGQPLTQEELDQFNADEKAFANTHDRSGNLIPQANPLGIGGVSSKGGTAHDTEAVFQQGDGQWVDSQGHPVTYNPTYGQWVENWPW